MKSVAMEPAAHVLLAAVISVFAIGFAAILCINLSRKFKYPKFSRSKKHCHEEKLARQSNTHRLSFGPWGVARGRSSVPNEGSGFNWGSNPRAMIDAAENGWEAFAFTLNSCPNARPPHPRRYCAGFDEGEDVDIEISWEIIADASDYTQRLRLIPGAPRRRSRNLTEEEQKTVPRSWSMQAALPLPGPQLDPPSFPATGYFEVTILDEGPPNNAPQEAAANTECLTRQLSEVSLSHGITNCTSAPDNSYQSNSAADLGSDKKSSKSNQGAGDHVGKTKTMSIGLAAEKGGTGLQPGLHPSSVGFHNSGSVLLNGVAAAAGDLNCHNQSIRSHGWGETDTVIGCGYDPASRSVFYTLNGELVYTLACKSEEFQSPMFPTIAANYDVTIQINYGQSQFAYEPANIHRVTDPCFRKQFLPSVPATNRNLYEDSGDLFSIGRVDSQCLGNPGQSSELFEIAIDGRK